MNDETLDRVLMQATDEEWKKVALILSRLNVRDGVDPELAKRIRYLAGSGALEMRGNPADWRASEIRRSKAVPTAG